MKTMIVIIMIMKKDHDDRDHDDDNNSNNNDNNNKKLRISNIGRPPFDNYLFMYFIVFIKFSQTAPQSMMTSSNGNIFRVSGPLCGVTGEFPTQRPVTRSFDVSFDLKKRLSKQSRGWWFETPSRSLWRHCNESRYGMAPCDPAHVKAKFWGIFRRENTDS